MGSHATEVILKFVDQFSSGFDKSIQRIQSGTLVSKKAINSLNQTGTQMLTVGTMMFLPVAAGIKKCLDTEIEYENAVAKVKTIADESQKSMADIGKEMQKISTTYGQDIGDVADTFYNVISATVDTANAIDYVHVASKMAIGGFADMNTAVGGLTSAMASYKKMGYDMYRIGDLLAQTQVYGKTTINELSQTLGTVLPFASNVGMSFEDLSAVMAVLTSNGLDTANATTAFKNAISSILSPSASATKAFEKLGLAYGSKAFSEMDFGTYLDNLKQAVGLSDKAQQELKDLMSQEDVTDEQLTDFFNNAGINIDKLLEMFGNIRGATAMLSLVGSINKFHDFRTQMNEENSKGVLERQANIMMESPEMQFKVLTQNLNEGLRKFGEKLMPKLNQFLGYANDLLGKLNSMSDEQISQIVDNTIKIAAAGASLMVLGTIAKALASILTLANTVWKPISKILFGAGAKAAATTATSAATSAASTAAATTAATGATTAATAGTGGLLAGIGAVLSKVIPAVGGFMLGMKLSETEIADDSLFKGKKPVYFDDPQMMEAYMRGDITYEEIFNNEGDKNSTTNISNNTKNQNNTYNETNNNNKTVNNNEVAYEKYDPKTNKFTNVYVSNVNVSGVENLDGIIGEITNAADNMR